jgi:tagatose 6-phosphate kinase
VIGGVAAGLHRGLAAEEALRLGVACGTAKVMRAETGLLRREDVEGVLGEVGVRALA